MEGGKKREKEEGSERKGMRDGKLVSGIVVSDPAK